MFTLIPSPSLIAPQTGRKLARKVRVQRQVARWSPVDVQHRVVHTVNPAVVVAVLAVLFHVLRNDVGRAVVLVGTLLVRPEPVRIVLRLDHLPGVDPVGARDRKRATILQMEIF